jgi:methylenetetrahydrofolate dehydrogenase (NADP+)/methenyltetrahydrofolate cyclohydrolase
LAISIDGQLIAQRVQKETEQEVQALRAVGVLPSLAAVLLGSDPASERYLNRQEQQCSKAGIRYQRVNLPADTTERQVLRELAKLNHREDITGIILQMPLPPGINARTVRRGIAPEKDVEGVHPQNLGTLLSGCTTLIPCTAEAVLECILHTGVVIEGKNAVVVGHSEIVGRPVALLLMEHMATVTTCHRATIDLPSHTSRADILVVAVGKAGLIHGHAVKTGAVVIDVGINESKRDGKRILVGDVDAESVNEVAGYLTPVPGGVGPVTVANLMRNTVRAAARQRPLAL